MHLKNTKDAYGFIAQLFHWGIFALFVYQFVVAEAMEAMTPDIKYTFFGAGKWALYDLHKSFGIFLLFLVFMRISWRMINPAPQEEKAFIPKMLARLVHLGLYAVMLIMPLSGYVMSMGGGHGITFFGMWKIPDFIGKNESLAYLGHEIHEITATIIYVLVVLHILAALYHYYIKGNGVLTRMLPVRKN